MFFKAAAFLFIQSILQASCTVIVNNCGQSINGLGTTYETVGLGGIGLGVTQNVAPATVATINVPAVGLGGLGALGLGIGVNDISFGGLGLGTGLVSYGNSYLDTVVTSGVAPATVGTISVPVGGLGGLGIGVLGGLGLGAGLVQYGNALSDVTVTQNVGGLGSGLVGGLGGLGLGSGLVSCGNSIPEVTVTQSVAPAPVATVGVPVGGLGLGAGLVQYGNSLSDVTVTQNVGGLGSGLVGGLGGLGLGSGLVSYGNSIPEVTVTQSVAPAPVATVGVPVGGLGSGIGVNEISFGSLGLGSGLVPYGNSVSDVTVIQSASPAAVGTIGVPAGGISSINTIGTLAGIPSTVNYGGLGTIGGVLPLGGLGTIGNLGVGNVGIGAGLGFNTITSNVGVLPTAEVVGVST